MVEIHIYTRGKWSGRRLAKSVKKKLKERVKGKCIWHWRVTLTNGKTVTVDDLEIIKKIS